MFYHLSSLTLTNNCSLLSSSWLDTALDLLMSKSSFVVPSATSVCFFDLILPTTYLPYLFISRYYLLSSLKSITTLVWFNYLYHTSSHLHRFIYLSTYSCNCYSGQHLCKFYPPNIQICSIPSQYRLVQQKPKLTPIICWCYQKQHGINGFHFIDKILSFNQRLDIYHHGLITPFFLSLFITSYYLIGVKQNVVSSYSLIEIITTCLYWFHINKSH